MHIEPIPCDIDADEHGSLHDPPLRMRARPAAARATVRVRERLGGRGAELRHGLARPRGPRAPVHRPARRARLSEAEQAALAARVFRGPDPKRDGVAAWTRADLGGWLEMRFGKVFHPSSLSRVLRRLTLSRQKTRSVHPEADPKAQERFP